MTLKSKRMELPENLGERASASTYIELSLDCEPVTPLQIFYVCFSNAGAYMGHRLLRQNFTHCSVMQKIPLGYLVTDPTRCALDTYILPDAPVDLFINKFLQMRPDYTVLEVIKEVSNKERNQIRFGIQSCVSVVAYTLGIYIPWHCITPHQLFKRLQPGQHNILSVRRLHGR